MASPLEEYPRQGLQEMLEELATREFLAGIPPEVRLKGLSAAERLRGLSIETIVSAMSPELAQQAFEVLHRRFGNDESAHSSEI